MSEEKDLKGQEENRETDAGFESKGQEMPGKRKGWRKQTADPKKAGEEKDTAASPGGPLVRLTRKKQVKRKTLRHRRVDRWFGRKRDGESSVSCCIS